METRSQYESMRKILMPIGVTLAIIILLGLTLYILAIPFNIYVIQKIFNYVVSRIINISGLNQWLVKGIVIIVLVPLLWAIPNVYKGKYKKIARAIGLIYMGAFFLTMYFVSKDIYFAHSGKEPLKWYALTPEGVKYYDSPGVDTIYGIPLKPVTPEIMPKLRLWEKGMTGFKPVDPANVVWFNPITGDPQLWYYKYPDGTFEFYNRPAHHPITGEPLEPVTKQIHFEWKERAKLKGIAVKGEAKGIKEQEHAMAKRPELVEKERRLNEFRSLINQSVITYPDKPNVAMIFESLQTEAGLSSENILVNHLKKDKINIIEHYFKEAFKTKGYFREIYGGNTEILRQSDALSKIDYIMIGRIDYTFRKGSQIDRDLVSCNISFNFRVINKKGGTVKSDSLSVVGPGFSEDAALERGLEILAERYSDRIMKPFL